MRTPAGRLEIITNLLGRHNAYNVLAAVAGGVVATVLLVGDGEVEPPVGGTLGVATALSF